MTDWQLLSTGEKVCRFLDIGSEIVYGLSLDLANLYEYQLYGNNSSSTQAYDRGGRIMHRVHRGV